MFPRSGHQVTLIERGPQLFSNVLSWGHVTLFSPNKLNFSKLGLETLEDMKVSNISCNSTKNIPFLQATVPKDEDYPTGHQYIETYLGHLATFLENVGFTKV